MRQGAPVIFMAVAAATARLFIWPDQGMPPQVSAIVMLDSPGAPLGAALRLAEQHRALLAPIAADLELRDRQRRKIGSPCAGG